MDVAQNSEYFSSQEEQRQICVWETPKLLVYLLLLFVFWPRAAITYISIFICGPSRSLRRSSTFRRRCGCRDYHCVGNYWSIFAAPGARPDCWVRLRARRPANFDSRYTRQLPCVHALFLTDLRVYERTYVYTHIRRNWQRWGVEQK